MVTMAMMVLQDTGEPPVHQAKMVRMEHQVIGVRLEPPGFLVTGELLARPVTMVKMAHRVIGELLAHQGKMELLDIGVPQEPQAQQAHGAAEVPQVNAVYQEKMEMLVQPEGPDILDMQALKE